MKNLEETINNICEIGKLLLLYFPKDSWEEMEFGNSLREEILKIKDKKGELEAVYDTCIVIKYSEEFINEEISKDKIIDEEINKLDYEISNILQEKRKIKYKKLIKKIENSEINKKAKEVREILSERENKYKKITEKFELSKTSFYEIFEEKYAKALEKHMIPVYKKFEDWKKEIKNKYEMLTLIENKLLEIILEESNNEIKKEKLSYAHST